jgi:hypothetical protein
MLSHSFLRGEFPLSKKPLSLLLYTSSYTTAGFVRLTYLNYKRYIQPPTKKHNMARREVCNLSTSNPTQLTHPAIVCLREVMPVAFYPTTPYIVMLALRPTDCVWECRHKTHTYIYDMLYATPCTVWLHFLKEITSSHPSRWYSPTLPLSLQCLWRLALSYSSESFRNSLASFGSRLFYCVNYNFKKILNNLGNLLYLIFIYP